GIERHRAAVELDPAPERAQPPGIGKAGPEARPAPNGSGRTTRPPSVRSVHSLRGRVPPTTSEPPMKAWGGRDERAGGSDRDEKMRAIEEAGIDLDPTADDEHDGDHDAGPHSHPHVQSEAGGPP